MHKNHQKSEPTASANPALPAGHRADASGNLVRKQGSSWRRWAVELALVVAVVLVVQWWQARALITGVAPALAGTDVSGGWLDLADRRGEPVLVHFWGTWCPICRLMDGAIAGIAEDHAVISVAMQSGDVAQVQAYLQDSGHTFPVLLDPDGQLARLWGVAGVPASFVLDPSGRIRFATRGASSGPGLRLRLWLAGFSAMDDAE